MNKTISVNIGGFVFNIEEEAYEALQKYLQAIKRSLAGDESMEEIMHDIELRIAELLKTSLNKYYKEVVNKSDIDDVIAVMGEPSAFAGEEEQPKSKSTSGKKDSYENPDRQVFRDPDDRMIGGVCSGLSAYFGWDPLVLRLIFVLLFFGFGTGLLLYIVLWIVIPEAKTTTEKLKMRGKKIDVETIKERFNDFKKDVENLNTPENKKRMKEATSKFADNVSEAARNLSDGLSRSIGMVLFVIAILLMIWLVRSIIAFNFVFSFNEHGISAIDFDQFGTAFFGGSTSAGLVWMSLFILLLIPVIALLLSGIRLIFNVRFKWKPVSIMMSVFSSIAVIIMVIIGIKTGTDFVQKNDISEHQTINTNAGTLIIKANHDPHFSDHFEDHHDAFFELIKCSEKEITYGYPLVDVVRSTDTLFHVEVIREARGANQKTAIQRATDIEYHFNVSDSTIMLDPFFTVPAGDFVRGQQIKVRIQVPIGKSVYFAPGADRIIYDVQNATDTEDGDMIGKTWQMHDFGLAEKK
jgi:phage shock protein PspC (stress-responsive transcriptional regulator)